MLAVAATIGLAIDGGRWRRLGHVAGGARSVRVIALPQLVAVLFATADSAIGGGRSIGRPAVAGTVASRRVRRQRAFLGTIQDRDPAVFAGGFESIGFIGVVVALLAVVGLIQAISSRRVTTVGDLAGCSGGALARLGDRTRTVVFRVAFEVIPGFDLARATARWLLIVVVVAALFAGIGCRRRPPWRPTADDLAGAVAATAIGGAAASSSGW